MHSRMNLVHFVLFVALMGPLVLLSQALHWGYTGIFVSVVVSLATGFLLVFLGTRIVRRLRRALGTSRAHAADFLFGPTNPDAHTSGMRAAHREVLARTQVSEWRAPALPAGHPRAPLAHPTRSVRQASRGRLTLGPEAAMELTTSLTSGLIVDSASPLVAPVFAEEWCRLGLGVLLIDVHGEYGPLVSRLAPGYGFLAGSKGAQGTLSTWQQPRYFALTHESEALAVGRGITAESLQVVLNLASYRSSTDAGMLLLSLLSGMQQGSGKPTAILVSDAIRLLPEREADCLIDNQDTAQAVYDALVALLEHSAKHGGQRAVYLVTRTLAGLEPEASAHCRLWIVNTRTPLEVQRVCQATGYSVRDVGALREGKVVLFDRDISDMAPTALAVRRGITLLPLLPRPTDTTELDDEEEDDHEEADTPQAPFNDAELAWGCYLYGRLRGQCKPTTVRRPSLDLYPAARAAGLAPARDRDLMRNTKARRLLAHVASLDPATRAQHASRVRERLSQQHQVRSDSAPGPPGEDAAGVTSWHLPALSLLHRSQSVEPLTEDELALLIAQVKGVLSTHQVAAEVLREDVQIAPRTLRLGVRPASSVDGRMSRAEQLRRLKPDLMMALSARTLHLDIPVPGTNYIGLTIPHPRPATITMRELLEDPHVEPVGRQSRLTVALGRDMTGAVRMLDLAQAPHTLIAGMTSSGKSVLLHTIICSLLMQATPDEVQLLMIDPKQVELTAYHGIPHLGHPVVTDPEQAVMLLQGALAEMERRYQLFASHQVRNLDEYRTLCARRLAQRETRLPALPALVILIDELANLMMTAPEEVEHVICRLAQLSRATGIHLVVATQRPSTDIVTGLIKANIPTRIACRVVSHHDSQTILDASGAEDLLGRGDMLVLSADAETLERVQGPLVTSEEVAALAQHWRQQAKGAPSSIIALPPAPPTNVRPEDMTAPTRPVESAALAEMGKQGHAPPVPFARATRMHTDALLGEAEHVVREAGYGAVALLRRALSLGDERANRLIGQLVEQGVLGPDRGGNRGRAVLTGAGEEDGKSEEKVLKA